MARRRFPIRVEDYQLLEPIGEGASATVHRARCIPLNEIVAIKILDFEKNSDLSKIAREAQTMILIDHPNVLNAHCSFVNDHNLWVVMPYMAGGSCFHIMKSAYPNGFDEETIAYFLCEALKGIQYLHQQGHIHRDIKAGNILVDARGGVKLGDFGVSASLYESGDRQRTRNTFVGTPCWMAPEVLEQHYGYDFKADIWSFGITALELAHGHAPFSSDPPMTVLRRTLTDAPPALESRRDKKFSKSFRQMIAMCLVKDPSKRPTAQKLLKHSFFKHGRSHEHIPRKVLEGLPSLGDRFHALKLKEAELLAQKKMLYGKKEEMSQNEYKRGISSWDFHLDDLKDQASLIPDNDDAVPGKDPDENSKIVNCNENVSQGTPAATRCPLKDDIQVENGLVQKKPDSLFSPGQPAKFQRASFNEMENYPSASCETEMDKKHLDNMHQPCEEHKATTSSCLSDKLPSIKEESMIQDNQVRNMERCNGSKSNTVTDMPSEVIAKASKATAYNAEDLTENPKASIVQQKGRFKVTSENVNFDKPLPAHSIPKSHSVQENIFSMTKQLSGGDLSAIHLTEGACGPASTVLSENSLLESANEREKELTRDIAELQWRLAFAKGELEKVKAKGV